MRFLLWSFVQQRAVDMFFTGTRKHVHRAGGQSPQKGSGREGGIIHDGARSGTRERGSEYGEAARSCTSGRGTGDAGPAGMMRGYAHPLPLFEGEKSEDGC